MVVSLFPLRKKVLYWRISRVYCFSNFRSTRAHLHPYSLISELCGFFVLFSFVVAVRNGSYKIRNANLDFEFQTLRNESRLGPLLV